MTPIGRVSRAGDVSVGELLIGAVDTCPPAGPISLGQAEVEHLDGAVRRELDVGRLQVAVDDAALVRGLERLGDLPRDRQRLVERERARARCARRASSPSTSSITSASVPSASSSP